MRIRKRRNQAARLTDDRQFAACCSLRVVLVRSLAIDPMRSEVVRRANSLSVHSALYDRPLIPVVLREVAISIPLLPRLLLYLIQPIITALIRKPILRPRNPNILHTPRNFLNPIIQRARLHNQIPIHSFISSRIGPPIIRPLVDPCRHALHRVLGVAGDGDKGVWVVVQGLNFLNHELEGFGALISGILGSDGGYSPSPSFVAAAWETVDGGGGAVGVGAAIAAAAAVDFEVDEVGLCARWWVVGGLR